MQPYRKKTEPTYTFRESQKRKRIAKLSFDIMCKTTLWSYQEGHPSSSENKKNHSIYSSSLHAKIYHVFLIAYDYIRHWSSSTTLQSDPFVANSTMERFVDCKCGVHIWLCHKLCHTEGQQKLEGINQSRKRNGSVILIRLNKSWN